MKRILLTTTSLVLAAGVAQADVSFSGTAGVALIDDNGAADAATGSTSSYGSDMYFESYYDFDITASAESDNGVSVSVGFDMGAGSKIDYNDDDKLEVQGNDVGDADVTVSYAGWTLAVDNNGIADLYDGDVDTKMDAKLSGNIAGWAVAVTTDQDAKKSSYSVSGAVGGITLTATGSNHDDVHVGSGTGSASKLAASYAMGDLTLSASVANEAGTAEDDATLGLSYAMDALTVGYTSIRPGSAGAFGDEWDL
ncbi:hypothetical protein N9A56_06900, partial [Planktomarina temperata]|nr:hypothetical protein [Planktomarina temperata]